MVIGEAQPSGPTDSVAHSPRLPILLFCILFGCLAITSGFSGPTEATTDYAEVATALEASSGSGLGRARPIALLLLGAVGFMALLRGRQSIAPVGLTGHLILLFVGVIIASFLWAEDPSQVMRRTAGGLLLFAAVAGTSRLLTLAELRIFVCFSLGLATVMGLGAEMLMGLFAPHNPEYRFHGLTNANSQGLIAGMLFLAVIATDFGERRALRRLLILVLLILIVLARSRGAMAATVAGLLVWHMLSGRSTVLFLMKGLLAASIVLPLAFLVAGENVGSSAESAVLMGREETNNDPGSLSGRMPLWTTLIENYVSERPLAGYGFQGFWSPDHIIEVSTYQDWAIVFAHSAYVDILLDLGILGLVLFVIILFGAFANCVRRSGGPDGREWAFGAALLAGIIVNSFLETVLLAPTLQSFVAMVVIVKVATFQPALQSASGSSSRSDLPTDARYSPAGGLS